MQEGALAGRGMFQEYLKSSPDDLEVRWLFNLSYMLVGKYPQDVPPEQLLKPEIFRSEIRMPRFNDVAAATGLGTVGRRWPRMRLVAQSSQTVTGKPAAPRTDGLRHRAEHAGNRPCRAAFVCQQDDPAAKNVALFRRRCPYSSLKHRAIRRRQPDYRCFGNHPNVESRIRAP